MSHFPEILFSGGVVESFPGVGPVWFYEESFIPLLFASYGNLLWEKLLINLLARGGGYLGHYKAVLRGPPGPSGIGNWGTLGRQLSLLHRGLAAFVSAFYNVPEKMCRGENFGCAGVGHLDRINGT